MLLCIDGHDHNSTDLIFYDDKGNSSSLTAANFSIESFIDEMFPDEINCLGRVCDDGIYWTEYDNINRSLPQSEWCNLTAFSEGNVDFYDQTVTTGCDKSSKEYTIVECPDLSGVERIGIRRESDVK